MTTTVVLANMPSTPTDVAVNFFDQTKLRKTSESKSVKNGTTSFQSAYVYADGDNGVETTVIVNINRVAGELYPQWRHSVRLATVQIRTVDSVVQDPEPIEVVISWNTPGAIYDSAKMLSMIGSAFSLVFNGVTTKVPNEGIMDAMNWGVTGDLYGA